MTIVLCLVLILAFLLSLQFPQAVITVSLAWVAVVRPSQEIVHVLIGGSTVTDTDVALALSVVSGLRILGRSGRLPLTAGALVVFAAWPGFYLVRALLPRLGDTAFVSPLVDLHIVSAYLLIIPVVALVTLHGTLWMLRRIVDLACIVSLIAVAGFLLNSMGALPLGETTFIYTSLNPLVVRPGGEAVIGSALAIVVADNERSFRFRIFAFTVLVCEVILSQTLTIVLGAAIGAAVWVLLNWRAAPRLGRIAVVAAVLIVALLASGIVGAGSRFNLDQRAGEDSAQYRVEETQTVLDIVQAEPALLVSGTGPGSIITFFGQSIDTTKRDTHNFYLTVLLKTGVLGLLLFVTPLATALLRVARRRTRDRPAAGGYVSYLVVSLTVPFIGTTGGFLVLVALWVCVSAQPERGRWAGDGVRESHQEIGSARA